MAEIVELVDVDDYTEPAEEPGWYAVYVNMSKEPGPEWRRRFEEEWRKAPTGLKRPVTVVGRRLRVEVHGDDMLREQLDFVSELVNRTNVGLWKNTSNRGKD